MTRDGTGTSPYESWVLRLRAWGGDPTVTLEGLPVLTAESLPPGAYERFLRHVADAVRAVDDGWQEALGRVFQRSRTPYELSVGLVQVRPLLARRLELDRHPSLPEGLREHLAEATRKALEGYQAQVEEVVREDPTRGRLDDAVRRELLRVVRSVPLTDLTDWSGSVSAAPAPLRSSEDTRRAGPLRPRRVVRPGVGTAGER